MKLSAAHLAVLRELVAAFGLDSFDWGFNSCYGSRLYDIGERNRRWELWYKPHVACPAGTRDALKRRGLIEKLKRASEGYRVTRLGIDKALEAGPLDDTEARQQLQKDLTEVAAERDAERGRDPSAVHYRDPWGYR